MLYDMPLADITAARVRLFPLQQIGRLAFALSMRLAHALWFKLGDSLEPAYIKGLDACYLEGVYVWSGAL